MTRERLRNLFKRKITFKLFMLYGLPMGFLAGLRVIRIDDEICQIAVKHGWVNQNPFKSMYFAVQAMAAEMSTGLPLVIETRYSKPAISTLVLKNSAIFTKKAVGLITFSCTQVGIIREKVQEAKTSGEPITIDLISIGRDEVGDEVATFNFTWTIKAKSTRA